MAAASADPGYHLKRAGWVSFANDASSRSGGEGAVASTPRSCVEHGTPSNLRQLRLHRSPSFASTAWTAEDGDSKYDDPEDMPAVQWADHDSTIDIDSTPILSSSSQKKDTTPKVEQAAVAAAWKDKPSTVFNARDDVGNIGWFFGNWGARTKHRGQQNNIDIQLKRCPAQIIGICECEESTEAVLRAPAATDAVADADASGGHALAKRSEWEYATLRGNEPVSVLVGVRTSTAESLDLLLWERRQEGWARPRNGPFHPLKPISLF
jgi:hypothetical protein